MSESILTNLNSVASTLESAVDGQDWSLVIEAYNLLTGLDLDEPKTPDNPGDILSELMGRLSRLEEKRSVEKPQAQKKSKIPKAPEVIKTTKSKTVRSTNKFEEMTDLLSEVGKEPGFKKINDKVKPIKRSRRPYKPARVECSKCKKTYEISPALARENYQCDGCIGTT